MLPFLIIIIVVSGLFHWFLYARLVIGLEVASSGLLWLLRGLAVLLMFSYILSRIAERHVPEAVATTFHWIASVWLGLMWELLWIALLLYLGKVVLMLSGMWGKWDAQTITMVGRYSVFFTISAAVILCGYGMIRAFGPARIAHVRVPIRNVTPELRNLRIAMASDFHVGVLIGKKQVQQMTTQIMSLKPDLILLPGDVVDQALDQIAPLAAEFATLHAPLGVYGSTGNHEYYVGLKGSLDFFQRGGIRALMNEWVELPDGLVLCGIEDRTARQMGRPRPTFDELLGTIPANKPIIFLNHSPFNNETVAAGRAGADLVLSGHAHAGQIWPFQLFSGSVYRYHWGLYKMPKGFIYTSSGIGFWGPPMRIFAPPEIALIELVGETEAFGVRYEKG